MVRHVLRAERETGRLIVIGYGRGARWRRVPNWVMGRENR